MAGFRACGRPSTEHHERVDVDAAVTHDPDGQDVRAVAAGVGTGHELSVADIGRAEVDGVDQLAVEADLGPTAGWGPGADPADVGPVEGEREGRPGRSTEPDVA